jgi:hypothetical protein
MYIFRSNTSASANSEGILYFQGRNIACVDECTLITLGSEILTIIFNSEFPQIEFSALVSGVLPHIEFQEINTT